VYGNPIRLRQMLSNLLDNAIKYSPEGGKIDVRAATENSQLVLKIADNGNGIPLAESGNIFDKFYRASNVPEGVPGTGLGLAIVKSIVENHAGRIWVDSNPGQGAVFSVVLPVLE
jgi:signal transduction histidine kinase